MEKELWYVKRLGATHLSTVEIIERTEKTILFKVYSKTGAPAHFKEERMIIEDLQLVERVYEGDVR